MPLSFQLPGSSRFGSIRLQRLCSRPAMRVGSMIRCSHGSNGLPPKNHQSALTPICTNTTQPTQDKSMGVSSTLPASALDANEIYLEPFLRAFCLGVGSGVILEVAHVAFKLANVAESLPTTVAPETLFSIIRSEPGIWEQFAPLFYADHAMAVLAWIAFYVIDVLAIKAILDKYNDDPKTANHALRHLVTLPKKMLPVRLGFVQKLVLKMLGRDRFMSPGTVNSISTTALHESSVEGGDKRSTTMPDDGTSAFNIVPSNVTTLPPPPTTTKGAAPTIENKSGSSTTSPDAKAYPGIERPGVGQRSKDLSPGQLNPDVKSFLRRRRELKQRSSYLTNQWYAAALSENLKADEPLGVDILGRRVLLFRDSTTGKVSCMDDACPHRGAPLSQGWMSVIEGHDCVTCPYHGWAFDGEGRLRDVPAAANKGEWPRRPIIPVHHVEEKGGFVWIFFGSKNLPEDARPPIPYVPELDDPEWKPVYGEIEFECNHAAVFENAIDMAHIHYLHGDSFGNSSKPEIRDMDARVDPHGVTCSFKLHNKPVSPFWEWTKVPEVDVTARAFLPSTSFISFTLGRGLSFITFVNTVPISANKTINRFALVRNLAWDKTGTFNAAAWDVWARKAMLKILGEDKEMVEMLRPELLQHEYSVRADLPQVAFRRLRQSYVDLGMYTHAEGSSSGGVEETGRSCESEGDGTDGCSDASHGLAPFQWPDM